MPQPRRKSSQAPNETRNQKGSCGVVVGVSLLVPPWWKEEGGGGGGTYHGDNVLLDGGREGDQLEVKGEVELRGRGSFLVSIGSIQAQVILEGSR
jgi:hypothetical protein